jgi:hypothetical protein
MDQRSSLLAVAIVAAETVLLGVGISILMLRFAGMANA